jgi:hypothetical protein
MVLDGAIGWGVQRLETSPNRGELARRFNRLVTLETSPLQLIDLGLGQAFKLDCCKFGISTGGQKQKSSKIVC